uniref:BRISC and BRCA1-A complex member 2 n=1 Tax=Trichogramma kaykai TaxID=54128 RepID=A0ABD2WD46_9HYME
MAKRVESSLLNDDYIDLIQSIFVSSMQDQSNGYQLSKIKIDKSNHRLIFSFPYVKEFRDWEIEFNPFHPELGPDLLLKDEELAVNEQNTLLDVDSTNILTWDPWNYLSINKLVDNLLKNHLQNQMRLLKSQAEKVALELEQLNAIPWLENTQISVSDKSKDQITVKLLAVLSWKNENFLEKMKFCSIEVLFQVMYLNMQCVHITSEVYLPLHFYELLNKPKMIHVATETTTLLENLHRIKEHVMEMVLNSHENWKKRKQFICALIALHSSTILEYDMKYYQTIALRLKSEDYHYILKIFLPLEFPKKTFTLSIISIYNMTDQGKTINKLIRNVPFSSTWTFKRMIVEMMEFISKKSIWLLLKQKTSL